MGPELEYVVNSGVWSLGGLVLGYALGRLHSRMDKMERHLDRIDHENEEKNRDDT